MISPGYYFAFPLVYFIFRSYSSICTQSYVILTARERNPSFSPSVPVLAQENNSTSQPGSYPPIARSGISRILGLTTSLKLNTVFFTGVEGNSILQNKVFYKNHNISHFFSNIFKCPVNRRQTNSYFCNPSVVTYCFEVDEETLALQRFIVGKKNGNFTDDVKVFQGNPRSLHTTH